MIYFIVYILDNVDHEDLPRDVFVCGTVLFVDFVVSNV